MKSYRPVTNHYSSRQSKIQAITESLRKRGFAVHVSTQGVDTRFSIRGNGIAINRLAPYDAQTFLMNWDKEHAIQESSSESSVSEAI